MLGFFISGEFGGGFRVEAWALERQFAGRGRNFSSNEGFKQEQQIHLTKLATPSLESSYGKRLVLTVKTL